MLLEVIVTNVDEARLAEQYGADRLELIHSFDLGGLSPALELSEAVCAAVTIPVCVMVRPQGHSFVYNQDDIAQIFQEIMLLQQTKAYGIVFGALTPVGTLNTDLLEQVINIKNNLVLTFHRAIDSSINPLACYQQLLHYSAVDIVLTSGGQLSALAGIAILQQMVELGNQHINAKVLAGSGVTLENVTEIIAKTGVAQIHVGSGVRTNGLLDAKKITAIKKLLEKLQ